MPENVAEAIRWFRLAAEQGFLGAQTSLAALYDFGLGVTKDHGEAAKWWRMAAEQDDPGSQVFLSLKYEDGEGVPQDYVRAAPGQG
ncbi:MAG: tetratricopeptide repeat protein [Devosia sp.]|nr:tetratricopeptide repeat protein [Devosia sp.]